MQVDFPYGKGHLVLDLPGEKLVGTYQPREMPGVPDLRVEVERALTAPVGSPCLRELACGRRTAAIVVDDVSRSVPTAELLPPVVDDMRAAGVAMGAWEAEPMSVEHTGTIHPAGLSPLQRGTFPPAFPVDPVISAALSSLPPPMEDTAPPSAHSAHSAVGADGVAVFHGKRKKGEANGEAFGYTDAAAAPEGGRGRGGMETPDAKKRRRQSRGLHNQVLAVT